MLGLGSILGTGAFVSMNLGASIAGPATTVAILLAALLAACNGLSSAQLAAAHPVAGGTYAYGYRWLNPWAGFTAGWMFLLAKSASAATAAMGVAGCLGPWLQTGPQASRWIALAIVIAVTLLVLGGLKRSNRVNTCIVSFVILALACLIFWSIGAQRFDLRLTLPSLSPSSTDAPRWSDLLHASAIIFVAFTGYGRIATLGEEVLNPKRTISLAIIFATLIAATLYLAIGSILVAMTPWLDPRSPSPLLDIAQVWRTDWLVRLIAIAGALAMLGVLLNLILGLSRVLLAMGRLGDMPRTLSTLNAAGDSPTRAVITTSTFIAALTLIGDIKLTWTFSALTVLIYYSLTNLAALKLAKEDRLYPRLLSAIGLIGCLTLAAFIPWRTIALGTAALFLGLLWRNIIRSRLRPDIAQ